MVPFQLIFLSHFHVVEYLFLNKFSHILHFFLQQQQRIELVVETSWIITLWTG